MSEMNIGLACCIFRSLDKAEFSDNEKMEAIKTVVEMETHNSIRREDCLKALAFLISREKETSE